MKSQKELEDKIDAHTKVSMDAYNEGRILGFIEALKFVIKTFEEIKK